MAWPKGKPRKGHVNKDGSTHKFRGNASAYAVADPASVDGPSLWGAVGTGAISEPCPNCGYAYADGGWCGECGWTKATKVDAYGTHTGRRF